MYVEQYYEVCEKLHVLEKIPNLPLAFGRPTKKTT